MEGTAPFVYEGATHHTWYKVVGDLNHTSTARRPLVILHGGPGMSHHYMLPHAQLHALFGIPVVFYDQLGIGRSTHLRDKPAGFWTMDLFMDELDNLLAHLGIHSNFDVLGNSWGAMFAGHYAAVRRPAGMKHFVIANGGASMALWEVGLKQLLKRLPDDVREAIERGEREGKRDTEEYNAAMKVFQMKHICKVDPWPEDLVTSFAATDEDPTVSSAMIGPSEFNVSGTLRTWGIVEEVQNITASTLLINAYDDTAQDVSLMPFFLKVKQVKWVQFAYSSHLPAFEEPARYFEVVGRFLTESVPPVSIGGTAGCVVAGRLAAADPSLRILVLEAGPPTHEDLAHVQPARYLTHLLPGSKTIKLYEGKESEFLDGRKPVVPCAQCLGGGSSVNFAMYARAAASDYDDWETVYGNPGWGSRDLLPLLKKCETYQVAPGKETHGYEGPLKVSYGGHFTNLGQQFLDVASRYDKTRRVIEDPNDLGECNAYARWQKWIDNEKGTRSDVPHHYIYNQAHNKNLIIMTGFHVKRVIFDGKRAAGVEYVPNIRVHPDFEQGEVHVARAARMIVLSAGAFGSPAILERSGIGADHLMRSLGIETTVDLPGVGENYQDHDVCFTPYLVGEEADTLDGIIRSEPEELQKWSAQWLAKGDGLMAHNGVDAGIKIRPSEKELEDIGPEFRQRWYEYYANSPDKPVFWLGALSMFVGDPSTVPARKYCSADYFLDYPASIGYVHITSAGDVNAAPDFDPKYLSRREDVVLLRWAYKRGREIMRRMPLYRGEYAPAHPQFRVDSDAVCLQERLPVGISAPDIAYTAEDNEAIDNFLRKYVATTWHSLGTCAMKARSDGGVVDSRLRVYGVEGLMVADLSIAPANVSANTYSTAVVIGEKAAVLVAEELGIRGI
ncbi:GMC oxidoreductase-domain-containing protein [Rhodofomes roseus]|uniref:GMC oxidoreductase-domain-containing protein n=1 Tax=Rhodofomes roseus TaxID=34475 RepID=A0ABQ8KI90_9APHY|nr:GMC oxidoreductase-domain-containing protein [Rhodofomes roseus]KAH9837721.1 GMC oxidoreductase-domain-containing protein [Rhodofomes roseus]